MSLKRRRSLSSAWRNRIQPVTVGPGSVSGSADLSGCSGVGSSNITLPLTVEHNGKQGRHSPNRSLASKGGWSLKRGFSFLRRSEKTPKTSVKKNKSWSILTSHSTSLSHSKRSSSNLNKSLPTTTPKKVSNAPSTKTSDETPTQGDRIQGALGLTPLATMFSMHSISTRNTKSQENQSFTKYKKNPKSAAKPSSRTVSRRKILGVLNRKDGHCSVDESILSNLSFEKAQTTRGYFTRSKSKSSMSSSPSIDGASSVNDLNTSKVSCQSVPAYPVLSREPSPGYCSINLSLESSIMNALYPEASKSTTDLSTTLTPSDASPPKMAAKTGRKMLSISTNTLSTVSSRFVKARSASAKNLKDADSFEVLVERLASHKQLPDDSPDKNIQSKTKTFWKNPSRVQVVSHTDSPVLRKRKQEVRFGEDAVIGRPRKVRRKSMGAAEDIRGGQKRPVGRPITRSRSLRVWRQKDSVEMTGQAGHTPLPRRRRSTLYNERLIM